MTRSIGLSKLLFVYEIPVLIGIYNKIIPTFYYSNECPVIGKAEKSTAGL